MAYSPDGSEETRRRGGMPSGLEDLVKTWFEMWSTGDYRSLPLAGEFTHTSPYGTIEGREEYLRIVADNEDQFLGFEFQILDELYDADKASVRYTARSGDHVLEASEWFFGDGENISSIISYYNIGDVSYDSMRIGRG
jgi:hypothetical protein